MQKIIVMIGLPGSGKSYWSEELVKTHPNLVCVSRDKVREMLAVNYNLFPFDKNSSKDSGKWSKLEGIISHSSIEHSIINGFDVVIDETHITEKSRLKTLNFVRSINPDLEIQYFYLTENQNNLKYRMESPKNGTENNWAKVIGMMKSHFVAPTIEECDRNDVTKFYKANRENGLICVR